jgi:hypothetical protein
VMATKDPRTPNSTRPGYAAPCLCVLWPPKPKPPNPPLGPLPPFHRQLLGIPHVAARSSCPPLLARVSYGTQNQCDGAGGIGWRRGSGVVFAWRRRRTGCLRSKRVYRTRTRTGTADLLGLTAVAGDLAMRQDSTGVSQDEAVVSASSRDADLPYDPGPDTAPTLDCWAGGW